MNPIAGEDAPVVPTDPDVRAWDDLIRRIRIDPRFPIPLEVSILEVLCAESPQIKIGVTCATTDATVTGPGDCASCLQAIGDAPPTCPHLNQPIDLQFSQWFPIRLPEAQKIARIVDLMHLVVAHELDEFVRLDGHLIRDPHATDPHPSRA